MSIQWTIANLFLYGEILSISLMLVPLISPKKWKEIFRSSYIQLVYMKANLFFNFFLIVLTIFLMDAIREIFKYKKQEDILITEKASGELSSLETMMEFRAQRNFYITGMALFLWFIIRHLILLISNAADLIDDCDNLQKENDVLKKELETLVLKRALDETEKLSAGEKEGLLTENMRPRSRSRPQKEP